MSSASEGRSTPEEASNDKRSARPRAAPPLRARGLLPCGSCWCGPLSIPAYILPPPTAVFMALYRGMVIDAVRRAYLDHADRDAARLHGRHRARLRARDRRRASSRRIEYFLYPFIVMFQAMPKVALAPLIIVWFGLGLTSKVVNAGAGRLLPADGQHHRRAALGRRGPHRPDALAGGDAAADLLDAAAAERAALHLRRARDRHDLRADRRHRRRVRRRAGGARHADPEHELLDGRGRASSRSCSSCRCSG